jgi:lysozyme family protein
MNTALLKMIETTIGKEGRYSNHPSDTGGATMWGITQAVARANGYAGDMRQLPRSTAVAIYYAQYAVKPGFAAIAEISEAIAEELFDTGVNMGPAVPAKWLQEWLNAMNGQAKLYGDIVADGKIGPATLNALRAYLRTRGAEAEKVMVRALNCSQGERYRSLAANRPANEDFIYGWLRTRVA